MRSRPGPFVFFHDRFLEHPKLAELSDGDVVRWISVVCWCARNETDGRFSEADFRIAQRRGSDRLARARHHVANLVAAGLIDETDEEGVYQVHDYSEWQETKEEKLSRRAGQRERANRHRERKRHAVTSRVTPEDVSRVNNAVRSRGVMSASQTDITPPRESRSGGSIHTGEPKGQGGNHDGPEQMTDIDRYMRQQGTWEEWIEYERGRAIGGR
jgi:hypothetical protein